MATKKICGKCVLVGTYRGDQLKKWRGLCNYPVSDGDRIGKSDAASITELWLFNGTKAQRTYKAGFVGVKTRKELIDDYGYPAKGKPHGDKYLLFMPDFAATLAANHPDANVINDDNVLEAA